MKITDNHTTIIELTAEDVSATLSGLAEELYRRGDIPVPTAPPVWATPPALPGAVPDRQWTRVVKTSRADDGGAIVTIARTR